MAANVCPGFQFAAVPAGIKKSGQLDLGLIYMERPAAAAAVFTRNRVQAAPVMLCRERLKGGFARAVVVNSGNANCCTGAAGLRHAAETARLAAAALGLPEDQVWVASTGVIGQTLPMEKISRVLPDLVQRLDSEGIASFADSILTTDTRRKIVFRESRIADCVFRIVGVAKGAGMIRPDMATMLGFICTDAKVDPCVLQASLLAAADATFNRITIDGDTSTNDMVLLLASGASGAAVQSTRQQAVFQQTLNAVAADLSREIVRDGEGATKLVEIAVRGAATNSDARRVADAVANSNLVKTAFFGEDANWGRIIAAAGRAGAAFTLDRVDLFFDDVQMVSGGCGCGGDAEARATAVLQQEDFTVTIDLHIGGGRAEVLTCDFSVDYVKINADYRS